MYLHVRKMSCLFVVYGFDCEEKRGEGASREAGLIYSTLLKVGSYYRGGGGGGGA